MGRSFDRACREEASDHVFSRLLAEPLEVAPFAETACGLFRVDDDADAPNVAREVERQLQHLGDQAFSEAGGSARQGRRTVPGSTVTNPAIDEPSTST